MANAHPVAPRAETKNAIFAQLLEAQQRVEALTLEVATLRADKVARANKAPSVKPARKVYVPSAEQLAFRAKLAAAKAAAVATGKSVLVS